MLFHVLVPVDEVEIRTKVNRCFPLVSIVGNGPLRVLVVLFMYFVPSTHNCRLVMVPCGGVPLAETCTGLVTDVSWNGEHILIIASTGAVHCAEAAVNPASVVTVTRTLRKS